MTNVIYIDDYRRRRRIAGAKTAAPASDRIKDNRDDASLSSHGLLSSSAVAAMFEARPHVAPRRRSKAPPSRTGPRHATAKCQTSGSPSFRTVFVDTFDRAGHPMSDRALALHNHQLIQDPGIAALPGARRYGTSTLRRWVSRTHQELLGVTIRDAHASSRPRRCCNWSDLP